MRACTVISAAELPYARVLADSLGPVRLTALVLDEPVLREDEPFDVLRPGDLEGVETWRLLGRSQRAATRYLEPRLLAHLGEAVLLASDLLVLEPLDALLSRPTSLRPISPGARSTSPSALSATTSKTLETTSVAPEPRGGAISPRRPPSPRRARSAMALMMRGMPRDRR